MQEGISRKLDSAQKAIHPESLAKHEMPLTLDPRAQALGLTLREFQVLYLLSHGVSMDDIAVLLSASPRAAKYYLVEGVYKKLGVHRKAEAINKLSEKLGPEIIPPWKPKEEFTFPRLFLGRLASAPVGKYLPDEQLEFIFDMRINKLEQLLARAKEKRLKDYKREEGGIVFS